ncbi:hypothetical protein [Oscillibacter sp.]|uniref:hypothetical protein n=1 Tax=Oscillibacter sp. TaxID=1945593 RepID=UPI002898C873|nr:hypothetical protein [Oscillibacter sp.]
MNNEEKILEILEKQGQVLEQHGKLLGTIQTDVADLKERVVKIEITQENVIIPSIQALAEGQANLLATLAPKNRVEALEDEVAFMKSVVKILSQEVAELKKAQ